jgi:hypothetical protein
MPSEGSVQDVYGAILEVLFPKGTPSRCPVVVLLEPDEGTRKLRRAIEKAAAQAERRLGVVLASEGVSAEGATLLPTSLRLKDVEAFDWDGGIDGAIVEASAAEVAELGLHGIDLAVVPASGGVTDLARAGRALALIAADRVVSADDPEALRRALKALDLPTLKADEAAGVAPEVVLTPPLATLREPDALLTQEVGLLRDALGWEREAVADLRRRLDQEQEERRTLQRQLAPPTQLAPQPAQEALLMVEELRRRLEASEAHIRTLVTAAPPAAQAGQERPGRPSAGVTSVEPSRGFVRRLLGLRGGSAS